MTIARHLLLLAATLAALPSFTHAAAPAGPPPAAIAPAKIPPRYMENLGRGVVALNQGEGKVWVSWRLLGTEDYNTPFNLYRQTGDAAPVRLNAEPLTKATCYQDSDVDFTKPIAYTVRAIVDGKEQDASKPFKFGANAPVRNYLSIPLKTPQGYTPNDVSVGDLDGDGEYEFIVHMTGRAQDNAFSGMTSEPIFQAYKLDGTLMWTINLGKNVREGAHYTQFFVYDLDGDGKAEIVMKTSDGTTDGVGTVIGDPKADWRATEGAVPSRDSTGSTTDDAGNRVATLVGRLFKEPEFLTVFDGPTGKALATAPYNPARGDVSLWGDAYANRSDRFLGTIAYLDGQRPSVVMGRGYYTRLTMAAWNWRDGNFKNIWLFDSDDPAQNARNYRGQGNHNCSVGDVLGDGRDAVVYGACAVNGDGKGLYATGLGHGDAMHLSDLDPDHPGLEVFEIHENPRHPYGMEMHDAATGKILWGAPGGTAASPDVGRGCSADIDPRTKGFECWSSLPNLYDAKGNVIGQAKPRDVNFTILWDGDLLTELLNGNTIGKWDWTAGRENTLFTAAGCQSNNGSKSTPALSADLFGDWREELVERTQANNELRIFTTIIPTDYRLYTLMHDPQYRLAVAWQNVAYNQPPHPGFYLGDGMKLPQAKPNIRTDKP